MEDSDCAAFERGAMSADNRSIVPVAQGASSQCPVLPCPYCAVALPHNATSDDVVAKCLQMTAYTNKELDTIVRRYAMRCGAARHILKIHDTARLLPAASSLFALVGEQLCRDYLWHMTTVIDPLERCPPQPHHDGPHPMGPAAAAGPQASTGSGSTPTGLKRWMDDDEFPQWQYMGGKKKNKWAPYDHATNEHLEGAYHAGAVMVELKIDEWEYTVNLRDLTQTNTENATIRRVRRLAEAEVT